jgi:hypothetical protein
MTDPSEADDRAAYVINLARHRCPELSETDLAALAKPVSAETLPAEIGEQIMDVLNAMMDRLDRLAEAVGVDRSDDNADQRSDDDQPSYDRRGREADR